MNKSAMTMKYFSKNFPLTGCVILSTLIKNLKNCPRNNTRIDKKPYYFKIHILLSFGHIKNASKYLFYLQYRLSIFKLSCPMDKIELYTAPSITLLCEDKRKISLCTCEHNGYENMFKDLKVRNRILIPYYVINALWIFMWIDLWT